MEINEQKLKKILTKYNIENREGVILFIKMNPENLKIQELARIAELVNNQKVDTGAYYTGNELLILIKDNLPEINSKEIRILEPSVGVGNFLEIIIDKYKNAKSLIIDVNDVDKTSLEICKLLNNKRDIPKNVIINYLNYDYLSYNHDKKYDLIVGNPPFIKITKNEMKKYGTDIVDTVTKNISGLFLKKAIKSSRFVILIMPKYFLSNSDFSLVREEVSECRIERIIDFGEKGFKGVSIETISIFIDTIKKPKKTISHSMTLEITNEQTQNKMTDPSYPYWLLYRNTFFEDVAKKMKFDIFSVYRDRQITNKVLTDDDEIRVLKSRNIKRDGSGIVDIADYDAYINKEVLSKLNVSKYLHRDDVFLSPNMTYYPRVIKKPKGVIVNGSVAILEQKTLDEITEYHLMFLSSDIFEKFYRIARNYSTRSLNIDKNSVYFFGLYLK